MPDAVCVRSVSVERDGRAALDRVDFVARHGEITAIIGPNGAGKSTLLKAIMGLVAYRGDIDIEGASGTSLTPRERARLVAFVPQQTQLRAPMAVRDVVMQGRYARSSSFGATSSHDDEAVDRAMAVANVKDLSSRAFTELSGGEQRRVLIARALATEARVLLFDEPTASLDIGHGLSLFALARAQADAGVAVVVVLHSLADALRFSDRATLLHQGRVVAEGMTADVITEASVQQVYGVRMIVQGAPGFEMNGRSEA